MAETAPSERIANCACGRLRAHCSGEPLSVSLCHCLECQRRTGSSYGVAAFFDKDAVRIEGESTVFERPSDSGYPVVHHFCSRCGSTVFWYPLRKPDVVAIAVGAFADPRFPAPSKAVYDHHRHSWVTIAVEAK
jgi:hypothetical protein